MGERLKEIRIKHNLTQVQIGEMMGVSGAYISKLEKMNEIPSDTFIYLFCQLFSVRREWLIKGEYPIQENAAEIVKRLAFLDHDTIMELSFYLSTKFLMSDDNDNTGKKDCNYLEPELTQLFQACPPKKRQLILAIAKLIAEH
jgi:transcriptional regulator with XRE-family HTH domain